MKIFFKFVFSPVLILILVFSGCSTGGSEESSVETGRTSRIITHTDAFLDKHSDESVNLAKSILHIATGIHLTEAS